MPTKKEKLSKNGKSPEPIIEESVLQSALQAAIDFDESVWIDPTTHKAYTKRIDRLARLFNTVTWTSGQYGKVSVTRFTPESETLQKINEQHKDTLVANEPIQLDRVYVAKYTTVYRGEKIQKTLGVLGVADGRAYLMTASYNFAVQSPKGENVETLHHMIATVKKAIALAAIKGLYDPENTMVFDDTPRKTPNNNLVQTESNEV